MSSPQISESLRQLSPKERMYVQQRTAGLSKIAACTAAGYENPKRTASDIEKRPQVQAALVAICDNMADDIGFTRKEAHDMLMDAYRNAATASEQIQAVKEMINLHGIAEPKKVEHAHVHGGKVELERLDSAKLLEMAGLETLAIDGEYEVLEPVAQIEDKSD